MKPETRQICFYRDTAIVRTLLFSGQTPRSQPLSLRDKLVAVGAALQGAVGPGELAAEHTLTRDREWSGEGTGARRKEPLGSRGDEQSVGTASRKQISISAPGQVENGVCYGNHLSGACQGFKMLSEQYLDSASLSSEFSCSPADL